jgi:type IV secretory pathway VirJ component
MTQKRVLGFLLIALAMLTAPAAVAAPPPEWAVTTTAAAEAPARDLAVIWISGDGGWGKMEKEVTSRLAAAGVPTFGVSALRYFSSSRDPKVAAAEIAAAAASWLTQTKRSKVAFVGFSFGADIGPFLVRDMPQAMREKLVLAAFLSPSEKANFQVSPASWMGIGLGPPVWPVMTALAPTKVLCIGGAGVFEDICPNGPAPTGMISVRLPGGHTLDNQYDAITRLILTESK